MKNKAIILLAQLLGLFLASSGAEAQCRMSLLQDPPNLHTVDLPPLGPSVGDLMFGNATLRDGSSVIGRFEVRLQTDEEPILQGTGLEALEQRVGEAIFRLGDNTTSDIDTLLAEGATFYPATGTQMNANFRQIRSVIGGTGIFKFARGQVTTTKLTNGSYQHDFELDSNPRTCKLKRYHQ